MVDQPLGERGGQHQLALGNGDEAVAQAMEPELGPAGLADASIEMVRVLDMAGRACRRREHPFPDAFGQILGGGPAAFENGRKLIGDGKLQRHACLRFLDAEGERVHVDPLPAERQHLVPAHAGVEPEPESVADRRVVDLGLDAGAPARQHLGRRRNLAPRLAVELAAAREPEIDRVAQPVMVDAGPAIDRAQQGHRPVRGRPAMIGGDVVEPGLDVRAPDGVERAGEPVAQIPVGLVAVELVGPLRAVGVRRHVLFEHVAERGHPPGLGAVFRRVAPAGDLAEELLRPPPRLVGGDRAEAADHDPLVGCLPAAVAAPVVDDEGLGPRGVNADAETRELCVPGDPGLLRRLEGLDGPLREVRAHPRGALSGAGVHGRTLATVRFTVNTTVNTRKELGGRAWPRLDVLRTERTYDNLLKYGRLGRVTVRSGRAWPQHQHESHNLKVAGSNPAPATTESP